MKVKQTINKVKSCIHNNKKQILMLSLIFMFLFSLYNRIYGIVKKSLWHEIISIYLFFLCLIKSIIVIYIYKSKERKKDYIVFTITKILLFFLNVLLIIPITLMILNKRVVEMTLVFSIVIALYVTIKTTKVIITFIKKKMENDSLSIELRTIDLMDVVLSILTLQNTLIAVNGSSLDIGMHYLTIISSVAGIIINIFFVVRMKFEK